MLFEWISDRENLIACNAHAKLNHMWMLIYGLEKAFCVPSPPLPVCDMTFHYNNSNQNANDGGIMNIKIMIICETGLGFKLWKHQKRFWQV